MKKIFLVISLFLFATALQAQWVVEPFESAAKDSVLKFPPKETGNGTGRSYARLSDTSEAKVGTKALRWEWMVHTNQSWGGYVALSHMFDPAKDSGKYLDFGGAKYISVWYKTVKPSTVPGAVEFRLNLHEASGNSKYYTDKNSAENEVWYSQSKAVFDDGTNTWKQLMIPLINNDPNPGSGTAPDDKGYTFPAWSGVANDKVLKLDKIVGWRFEATSTLITKGDSTANGIVLIDNLQLLDVNFKPIETFETSATTQGYYSTDNMSWGSQKGAITLSDDKTSPLEGTSALKIDYNVDANQSWGGYVNMSRVMDSTRNLSANEAVYLYWRLNKQAVYSAKKGKVTCRFVLFDDSQGAGSREEWLSLVNVDLDTTKVGEWNMLRIPLENLGTDWDLTPKGFKLPQNGKDGIWNLSKVGGFKIEFSASAESPFTTGYQVNGSISFDLVVPSGYRETDVTAPNAPTGVSAVAGKYQNLISWNDVAGETGEKYDIYYSTQPITDLKAAGVELLKLAVPENTGVATHLIRYPLVDTDVTYYYAVVCTDKAGNVGKPGAAASALKNKAKGVPTVANVVPTNFKADGILTDFTTLFTAQGFKAFTMKNAEGTANVPQNNTVKDDADCSATAYIAMDNTNLYVAFDITDDIVDGKTAANSYERDCPDLFIGFYDFHGIANTHTGKLRGAKPDYQIRFNQDKIMIDGANCDSLVLPGTNYYWGEKLSGGYVVEAKIPLQDLAKKRNSGQTNFDDLFVPKEGMRLPIDIAVNDADATGKREGMITYSPNNEDKSYQDVMRWLDTWYGKKATVGVERIEGKEMTYQLAQNYPNPFNPSTTIKYSIANPGKVTLKVYDVIGKEITTLVNQDQEAGSYQVRFDASNLSSGIYFYRIESGSFSQVSKMMLIK